MKKWVWRLSAILAAAAVFLAYRFLSSTDSGRQLSLWYVSGDFSPSVMELLASQYNTQRQEGYDGVTLRGFASEEELAIAYEQSKPDLLLCSYDRAASLGSREQLAVLEGADWDYLPEIEDSLPFAGYSFYPMGSAVPLLVYNGAALAESGVAADFSSLEGLCATAKAYREKTGRPFFSADELTPLLAAWTASLGYTLYGETERDALNESFCRVYNQMAQCTYEGSFVPPMAGMIDFIETGELPCGLISSRQVRSLGDDCSAALLPLPTGGEPVYVPEIMGLAVTGANSYALPSVKAFILWLRENYGPGDALALGLVPATGTVEDRQPDGTLGTLLMETYENRSPKVYAPLSSYMEQRQEMEQRFCHALDLLY